jgi:two-component system, NtrC family, sensor histidine kinase HydH
VTESSDAPPALRSLAGHLESLQALTPGLVHEFRNPLSGILAGSQMLGRLLGGAGGAAQEYVEILIEEAQQLEGFLARLAEFGHLGSRGLALVADADLDALLDRALAEIAPACRARAIRLVPRSPAHPVGLRADPMRLAQAVRELLHNAMQAMPDGGTLSVGIRRPGVGGAGWVEVEIADSGEGLTVEARRRAFEPFFSTRPRALGVGLCLARVIVDKHGGTLALRPGAERGAVARLCLPVAGPGAP